MTVALLGPRIDALRAYATEFDLGTVGGLDQITERGMTALALAKEMANEYALRYPQWLFLDSYYYGNPPLPRDPHRLTDKYREMLQMSRSNWIGLVVNVVNERLRIKSIRSTSNPVQDKKAWSWWTANNMDGVAPQVHSAALRYGLCYLSVWPREGRPPKMMGESPLTCHVRFDAETDEATAALRVWQDNVEGVLYGDLTLADYQFHLVCTDVIMDPLSYDGYALPHRAVTADLTNVDWQFRLYGPRPPVERNPLGFVPYTRILTDPDLTGTYRGEIEGLIPLADRIHKTTFDRLMAQAFASFPRAWITGIDVPKDPATGKPREPFDAAVDRLWTIESENAKVGQLDPAELDGYIRANTADIQALATQSRVPPSYFMAGMGVFPSGESVKATEFGLSQKVGGRKQSYGDGWDEHLRKTAIAAGNSRLANDDGLHVTWDDVEARSEGEMVDALIKMGSLGVPWPALWQRWGASTEEVDAWTRLMEENAARAAQALSQVTATPQADALIRQAPGLGIDVTA